MSDLITDIDIANRYLRHELDCWRPDPVHAAAYAQRNPAPFFAQSHPNAMERPPLKDVFIPRMLVQACIEVYGPDWQFWPQFQWDGTCFLGAAQVLMGDGRSRAIAAVRVNDEVVTHTGMIRKVLHTSERTFSGQMIHLSMAGSNRSLLGTDSHPVLIRRVLKVMGDRQVLGPAHWNTLNSVRAGDYILVPDRSQQWSQPIRDDAVAGAVSATAYTEEIDASVAVKSRIRQIIAPVAAVVHSDMGYYVRVAEITRKAFKEVQVFNIDVEEENSYLIDGFAVHNCVGQSHKLIVDCLAAVNRFVGGYKFMGRAAVAPIYAMSRVEIGHQPGTWQGSNGGWAAEALHQGAYLTLEELGFNPNPKTEKEFYEICKRDEQLALQWTASRDGAPDKIQKIAADRPVQYTSQVSTIEEVRASISELKPVNLCGGAHPSQDRNAAGRSVSIDNGGGHSTWLAGQYYDEKEGRWYYDHFQSWGKYYRGGYARQNSRFKADSMFQFCVTQVPESWVMYWLRSQDCYSISGITGAELMPNEFRMLCCDPSVS